MITRIPQDPDEIVTQLIEPLSDAFSGLIHGSMQAREHFAKYDMQINAPLAADITRFHARHHIENTTKIRPEYFLQKVNNNGIRLRAGLANIKVVKGLDSEAPCPNKTRKDSRFYEQRPVQPPLIHDVFKPFEADQWPLFAESSDKLNLILCWETDSEHRITRVSLMCPRKVWKYRQSAELYWKRAVPAPFFASESVPDLNSQYEDFDDLEVFFDDAEDLTGTDD